MAVRLQKRQVSDKCIKILGTSWLLGFLAKNQLIVTNKSSVFIQAKMRGYVGAGWGVVALQGNIGNR